MNTSTYYSEKYDRTIYDEEGNIVSMGTISKTTKDRDYYSYTKSMEYGDKTFQINPYTWNVMGRTITYKPVNNNG